MDENRWPEDLIQLAERFKALSDITRLRILKVLPAEPASEDAYNVSALAEELDIPQPTVSHHLKVLYNAGLLKARKTCRDVYYWIDKGALGDALHSIKQIARFE